MVKKLDCLRRHSFYDIFDKDSVIVDLGGYKGQFSKYFAKRYPFKKIIIVEANPGLIPTIQNNLAGFSNIHVIQAAISASKEPRKEFFLNKGYCEASSVYPEIASVGGYRMDNGARVLKTHEIKQNSKIDVKSITLQDIYAYSNRISLLKMNTEGAEWDIIENFTDDDFRKIDQISVEFHDFMDKSLLTRTKHCIKKLSGLGYRYLTRPGDWGLETPYGDCVFYKK